MNPTRSTAAGHLAGPLALAFVLILLALSSATAEGKAAEPSATAARDGFSVLALITADPTWREKWNTSPESVPTFATASELAAGDEATLLLFFSGAVEQNGKANLLCDVTIRDIGKAPESYPPHPCFEGPLGGSADYIYLTTLEITLVVGPTDPPGIVVFELGVTDVNRGLRLAVAVSVEVDPDGNSK